MIVFNRDRERVKDELEILGVRHSRENLNDSPRLYVVWLDALCEALKQHDPEFTVQIEEKWRVAMQPGIDLLISRY